MTGTSIMKPLRRVANWRDAGAYAGLVDAGRCALAWEVLRRDPAYDGSLIGAGDRVVGGFCRVPLATPETTAQFGVFFRRRSSV